MDRACRGSVIGWSLALAISGAASLAGCAKEPEVGQTTPAGPAVPSALAPALPGPRAAETKVSSPPAAREMQAARPAAAARGVSQGAAPTAASPLQDIFFDYDQAVLSDAAKRVLDEDATWLRANPAVRITIEGHCDERGTAEYNLALGNRRATAVRDYLVRSGVEAGRMRTLSYGKERPFAQGHDESAWRWNRRAHFVLAR